MNTVTVKPGDDLNAAARNNPPGTTFQITPGIYRGQSITPQQGQIFAGEPGAVLLGALPIALSPSGNVWAAAVKATPGTPNGLPAGSPQTLPEDLFYDGRPLTRVGSLGEVAGPGKWFYDYSTLVASDDPTGHAVELSLTRCAFSAWGVMASDVEIRGLSIARYAIPAGFGAIGDQYPAPGWWVHDCEIGFNHGVGVNLGPGSRLEHCSVHDNGHMGVAGGGHGIVIDCCSINGNNWARFDPAWAAGGIKLAEAIKATISNCSVRENNGAGIWLDVDCMGVEILRNLVGRNLTGITAEISWGTHIAGNTCEADRDSQILVAASPFTVVEDNRVLYRPPAQGIVLDPRAPTQSLYGWHSNVGLVMRRNWDNGVFIP